MKNKIILNITNIVKTIFQWFCDIIYISMYILKTLKMYHPIMNY